MSPYESLILETLKKIQADVEGVQHSTTALAVGLARLEGQIATTSHEIDTVSAQVRELSAPPTTTTRGRVTAVAVPTAAGGGLIALLLELVSRFG